MKKILISLIITISLFLVPLLIMLSLKYCPYIIVGISVIAAILAIWYAIYLDIGGVEK